MTACAYCGRNIRAGITRNGEHFHRSCWDEMNQPDDPRTGHARHDIREGRS